MADASSSAHTSTPTSASSSAQHHPQSSGPKNGPAAPKDRACPYCHVNFTSSSLGRHLDLYIKEKNPKPPDGIHNVEEIRKSRSGITRRQAKRDHHGASRDAAGNHALRHATSPTSSSSDRKPGLSHAFRNLFNTPHWTSTGVITDSDANQQLMNGDGVPVVETPSSSGHIDYEERRKWIEERERGRAAELALQELIESIKAAGSQGPHPDPFDFDFFSCSFTDLCLRLLPAPTDCASDRQAYVPDFESWSMDPPAESQYLAMQHSVRKRIMEWRAVYFPPNPKKRHRVDSSSRPPDDPDSLEPNPLYQHHLTSTWYQWNALPLMKKGADWHMAMSRAFARESHAHAETKKRLDNAETELNRARLDNARLTECQMPREWLYSPAAQLPMSKLVADKIGRELRKEGLDVEKLISKWRPHVQAARTLHKDDSGTKSRLMMVGPVGTGLEPPTQTSTKDARFNGQAASTSDGAQEDLEEDYESEDDEEMETDDSDKNPDHDLRSEPMLDTNGSIAPSLRHQMGAYART